MELETPVDLKEAVRCENIATMLTEDECTTIARKVVEGFELDRSSRSDWEEKMAGALDLALQVSEEKTFPWQGCSNVKFPLITIAALQFHARAYPALIPGPEIVQCKTFGADPDGRKAARSQRVASHMSYQVLEEDEGWEDNMDRVLITVPIVGCAFKKSYFDPGAGHNVSENILAKDIYVPYFAQTLEKASRITQVLYLSPNEIVEKVCREIYCDGVQDIRPMQEGERELEASRSQAQGINPVGDDPATPYEILEQHCWMDLDCDGYQEPYIVSVRKDTEDLCRIVARFSWRDVQKNKKGEITHIKATNYFTKYPFIPSPDGGIYDLGWGVLLGPLNESINTTVNQLIDAGTLATTGGGFLGRGAKFRSGDNSFKPFEWKRVDATGDDLRKSIVPLTIKEPSMVLFQLLQLLISYGERVAGATDPQVGVSPGQNTPAETSRNTIAEGQRVFQGIFKRLHRAMKEEFRKLYRLNQVYMEDNVEYYSTASGMPTSVLSADYAESEKSICPSADPNMVSGSERLTQAQFLKQAAGSTPGYDTNAVERRFLEALRITDVSAVYPGKDKVPPLPNAKMDLEKMKLQEKAQESKMKMQMAALELLGEADLKQAQIGKLRAESTLILAEAKGVDTGHQLALINAQIGATKAHQDSLLRAAKLLQDGMTNQAKEQGNDKGKSSGDGAGVQGMAGSPSNAALSAIAGGAQGGQSGGMG
jgi:chaperonin GroES